MILPEKYGFWLTVGEVQWLATAGVPLFISRRRLRRARRKIHRAIAPWMLDSGGFTEIERYGSWDNVPESTYVQEVRRAGEEIGMLQWAAPQDWMCEPHMLKRTGKSIAEHQTLTTYNFLTLRMLAADLPFVPVLQGWRLDDYLRHVDLYLSHGVDLAREPLVGLGSVCRRQHTGEAERIIFRLSQAGIRLHGFGFKVQGLERAADLLHSSDSMAWSYNARRNQPLPGCPHLKCANCLRFALAWRERLLARLDAIHADPAPALFAGSPNAR